MSTPTEVQVAPLDAIVIERSELPEVTPSGAQPGWVISDGMEFPVDYPVVQAMQFARRYLALSEYLTANPPVDEAQVQALADRLAFDASVEATNRAELESIARRLVQNGVRVEVTP